LTSAVLHAGRHLVIRTGCGVVDADRQRGAPSQAVDHARRELEAQEVHDEVFSSFSRSRSSSAIAVDLFQAVDLHVGPVLDADQPRPASRLRTAGSSYSIIIVAFQVVPSGTSGP